MEITRIDELIKTIMSSALLDRNHAVTILLKIRNPIEIKEFFFQAIKSGDFDLQFLGLSLAENLLEDNHIETAVLSLIFLNSLLFQGNISLANNAKKLQDSFFRNTSLVDQYKKNCLLKAWQKVPGADRMNFVRIIRVFKYQTLVSILVEGLSSKDENLVLETIETLIVLNDTRGNRALRALLIHKEVKLVAKAIEALGHLGNVFDLYRSYHLLKHSHLEVKQKAIRTFRLINPKIAIFIFKNIYNESTFELKKIIISETAEIKNTRSLKLLLNWLDNEKDKNIQTTLEWSIYNLATRKKIKTLISVFQKAKDQTKFKIINMMADFQDHKCQQHYLKILNENYPIFLKLAVLGPLAAHKGKKVNSILNHYANRYNDILGLTAFDSMLRLDNQIALSITLDFIQKDIPLESSHHLLLLQYIKSTKDFSSDGKIIQEYLLKILQEAPYDAKFMALSAIRTHHSTAIFNYLLKIYKEQVFKSYQDGIKNSVIDILNYFPFYLTVQVMHEEDITIIEKIDFYQCRHQLLVYLIKLSSSFDSGHRLPQLLNLKSKAITHRLNIMIQYNQVNLEDGLQMVSYLLQNSMPIHFENIKLIKDNYYSLLELEEKRTYLEMTIKGGVVEEFDFISNEIFSFKDEDLNRKYYQWINDKV